MICAFFLLQKNMIIVINDVNNYQLLFVNKQLVLECFCSNNSSFNHSIFSLVHDDIQISIVVKTLKECSICVL